MHELSVMTNILEIVLQHAEKNKAKRVSQINLVVGELSDLIPEWMQNYFDFVSKDSIAENAKLQIERIPAIVQCKNCKNEFQLDRNNLEFSCIKCNGTDVELLSGREFLIKSIEVE